MQRRKAKVLMTRPEVGIPTEVLPGIELVLAPNPGPMTYWGTNCYILGDRDIAVIDPGPNDPAHIANLLAAIGSRNVTHILITHAHADHSAGAIALSRQTGAPILGFGAADAGRRPVMSELARAGHLGGGEGLDPTFSPDRTLADADVIHGSDWALNVLHIPGHFAGHLGFQFGDTLFVGDHVMDWSTSIVSPPDGHLGDFLETCDKLISKSPKLCLSGHGAPITAPTDRLTWLVHHRKSREAQILEALSNTVISIDGIVEIVYPDIPVSVRQAAARNVLAHLIDLWERNLVEAFPKMQSDAEFRLR